MPLSESGCTNKITGHDGKLQCRLKGRGEEMHFAARFQTYFDIKRTMGLRFSCMFC